MSNCHICDINLEVGEAYNIPLHSHTCEYCGYLYDAGEQICEYLGLAIRGGFPTHIFLNDNEEYLCPECGKSIRQVNMPCNGGYAIESDSVFVVKVTSSPEME